MKHQRVLTFIDLTLLIMNIEGIKQRVYHGSIVQIADFEKFWGFIVSIHQIEREEGHHKWLNFMCGGTIFSKRHVLTAAHCMIKWQIVKWGNKTLISELIPSDWLLPKDFMIASNSPMQEIGSIGQILHKVLSYKVHQKYREGNEKDDIALMLVDRPFEDNLVVIRPSLPNSYNIGWNCKIAGWGQYDTLDDNATQLSDQLRVAEIRTCTDFQDIFDCFHVFGSHKEISLLARNESTPRQRPGDSGVPLVCFTRYHLPYLTGVVSRGKTRKIGGSEVFVEKAVNVFHYLTWIIDTKSVLDSSQRMVSYSRYVDSNSALILASLFLIFEFTYLQTE